MDNLQFLHKTLSEYNLLDKSFEEFQANSVSDKSYQQKIYQETSKRGMFRGSFVEFQNKYFPTQTIVPTSTTTTTTKTKTQPKVIVPNVTHDITPKEQLSVEQNAVNKDFWKNAGWTDENSGKWVDANREDYFKKNNKWYYKRPTDGKEFELSSGKRYDELIREEQEIRNQTSTIIRNKKISEVKSEAPPRPTHRQGGESPEIGWTKDNISSYLYQAKAPNGYIDESGKFIELPGKPGGYYGSYTHPVTGRKHKVIKHPDADHLGYYYPNKSKLKELQADWDKKWGTQIEKINRESTALSPKALEILKSKEEKESKPQYIHQVNTQIIGLDDDDYTGTGFGFDGSSRGAISHLTAEYGKHGFTFSSKSGASNITDYSDYDNPEKETRSGKYSDMVFVTAPNGDVASFSVDSWSSGKDAKVAESMTKWMRERSVPKTSVKSKHYDEIVDLKIEQNKYKPEDKEYKEIEEKLENLQKENIGGLSLEERKEIAQKEFKPVSTNITDLDDDHAVDLLIDQYGKYGFKFYIDRTSGDKVKVTSYEGDEEWFSVDSFFGDLFGGDTESAKALTDWMKPRSVWFGSKVEALHARSILNKEEVEEKHQEGGESIDKNIKSIHFKDWIDENREELPRKRSDLDEDNPPQEHIDVAEKYWDGDIKAMYDFMYSGVKQTSGGTSSLGVTLSNYEYGFLTGSELEEGEMGIITDGGKLFDKSRSEDIEVAIQGVAFDRFIKKHPRLEKWEGKHGRNAEIYRHYKSEIETLKSEIKEEWEQLTSLNEATGEIDWDAIYNSDVYIKTKNITGDNFVTEETKKRISEEIEGMGGEAFSKSEAQDLLAKEFGSELETLNKRAEYIVNSIEVISKETNKIKGDGETYGLEYEVKWLKENEDKVKRKIKEIQSGIRSGAIDQSKGNAKITSLINEFNVHYENYKQLRTNQSDLIKTSISLQLEAEDVLSQESDFQVIKEVLDRNHQVGTQSLHALRSGAIDLLQGITTAAEALWYHVNLPFGKLGHYLIDSGVIENESLKTFIEIGSVLTGTEFSEDRFDSDPDSDSMSQRIHGSIDAWQEEQSKFIQEPPKFGDMDGFSDFGEWASVMFAGQAPQLALLMATGGQSIWLSTSLLAGSAGGQKYMGMEEQKKLFNETGGLYGQDFGINQMLFSSAAVGIAEGLSERITFGQIKGVSNFLKTNKAAREGFTSYIRKEMFSSTNLKKFGIDLFQEGGSEVVATISENMVDIINGGENGIFDNVAESFVSGAIISSGIKSPILFHHMTAPFVSSDNKGIIDNNQRRIDQLLGIISMGRPTNQTEKEWEETEKEYIKEIDLLYKNSQDAMAFDIKRVDVMNTEQGEKHKRELLDIHNENTRLERQVTENNNNPDLTKEQRLERYNELNNKWRNNNQRKSEILGQYTPDVVNSKYENMWNSVKARAKEFTLETNLKINMKDGNSVGMIEWLSNQDGYKVVKNKKGQIEQIVIDNNTRKGLINQYRNILNDPNISKKERKETKERLDLLESDAVFSAPPDVIRGIIGESGNYGAMIPKFDNDGNLEGYNMFINKATSYDSGKFNTAAHEFLHGVLYQTLQQDAGTQKALTETILNTLNKKGVVVSDAIMETINSYAQEGARAEEILTIVSEAYIDGDIKLPKSAVGVMKNFFRRWSQNKVNGKDIAFDTDEDVINFIKDYSYSMKNNKQNRALIRMMKSGVSGKLIAKAQEHRDEIKKNTPTKGEAMFSRNVDQELNNNPDLLTEIDAFVKNEDGTPKYTDKNTWQTSTDFVDAWQLITQSKKLDGLIQAGMVGEGVNTAQALGEFTRKVKDELGERLLKNFNPAKNDSLFGWLTGRSGGAGKSIIYRAKGDVMVEYSKQIKTTSIDKGVTTTEGDTFSSQLEGEIDIEMEKLETKVITIGKETVNKSDVDIVFLESVNANPTVVKSISNIVENSGVNLEGLTYNGTKKNLIKHDGGKPKSKRKPIGPLYKVLDIISKEFGVDGMRIIKEQDLTNTQRNIAREYISKNAQKLIDMMPEGENRSGDATGVANTVLGEFYIKGERISMAEAGTGKGKISQTKRGDITVAEFTEFFNKPATKSDGAIRALIVQAATISANQAIRLNAISKQSDPISTIALVGDGKSAMMFSNAPGIKNIPLGKNPIKVMQGVGSIDRNLSPEAKDNFWTNINVFANENILDRNLDSIKIGLENAYAPFPEILQNVDQIAKSIHNVVKQVKDPIIKNPIKLSEKLLTTNENQLTKVQQSSNSDIDAAEAYRDAKRVSNYVATTTVLANQIFDPSNLGLSIAKIMMMRGHLASMGKNNYLSRKQIFPGTKEFLANTLGKIPGIEYTTKKSKDGKISLDTLTYNGQEIVMSSILSSQSSGTALSDTKSEIKMEKRDANEDMAQETLNDIVTYYSNLFKRGEIDNVDLMMVKASLLSSMNSVLARAAKLKYVSENANNFKDPGKQLRYEHMLPRVAIVINMFDAHINGDGISNIKEHLKNYTVQIIPVTMDKAISDAKLGSSLLGNQTLQDPSWIRNYNSRTQGDKRLVAIKDIITGEVIIPSKAFVLTNDILLKNRKANMAFSKAVNQANITNENTPSRGMSAFDFDETVGISDNFVIAKRDGKTKKISSVEWPFVGENMKNEGWEMDFTDFNRVTDGRPGPLMDKLRNRIKKFGPENNYILTARASESETSIHAWLKEQGINIPLGNITGLGNSTGAAKAEWIVNKFAEGYNDIYFVDDALPNVKAVKNVMDQLDIKGSSVQAKIQFSKRINPEFNNILNGNVQTELDLNRILEQTKGVKAEAVFSEAQAKVRGANKGKWKFWVPPSAEDFKGLIYRFIGKGRQGEGHMAFFKKALFDPFSRANEAMNRSKQKLQDEYRGLLKKFPSVKPMLNNVVYNNFTLQQMIRVYNWNKAGFEIPGLSQRDLNNIIKEVEGDVDTLAFANSLSIISNQEAGYIQPGDFWMVENIQSDINTINNEINRVEHLAEWKQNIETMFGVWENGRLVGPNMNKIEAIYGTRFRDALEDIVWRMEFGTKRQQGNNRLVNAFNNWANQSVGAIMFFNMRSALLQTISSINYLNWSDNNPLKAGLALANVPQFIKDFTMIFNSNMLRQRRAGNQRGINEAELAEAVAGNKFSPKAIINWLLTKGFLPTQIADSFAISSGGATFYRNRVNSLMKQGMTQEQAEARAWEDFQENTEESQQSSRPDMISQQQASPLGRYILAFKNTPMQYARLTKKAWLDLINGRGDAKTNIGKIIYYMGVQNLIFSGLQAALGAMIGDDDEEKNIKAQERVANSMIDSVLGGLGFAGNAVATLKNMILEFNKQEGKGWNADHTYTILKFFSFSPTIGSKGRKLYSAIQEYRFNKDVIKEMDTLDIDNPKWAVIANLVSALTNIPLDRLVKKMNNIDAAITEDITAIQRFALLMGWNTWDLDIDDSDVLAVEEEIKKKKEEIKEEKKLIKKEEKKIEKEKEEKIIEEGFIEDQKQEKEDGKKDITCVAVNKSGKRCKTKVDGNNIYCTIHEKVEQGTKEVQCKKIKSNKKRCGMMTKAKSGYCYYHD